MCQNLRVLRCDPDILQIDLVEEAMGIFLGKALSVFLVNVIYNPVLNRTRIICKTSSKL
jgi:hypothetical protein